MSCALASCCEDKNYGGAAQKRKLQGLCMESFPSELKKGKYFGGACRVQRRLNGKVPQHPRLESLAGDYVAIRCWKLHDQHPAPLDKSSFQYCYSTKNEIPKSRFLMTFPTFSNSVRFGMFVEVVCKTVAVVVTLRQCFSLMH